MKAITLFSDGSSLGNPGPGGYCSIVRYHGHEKIIYGSEPHTTNNRMELKAVIEGLKALKEPCSIEIISDSNYVVKGINEWLEGWVKKDFHKVKNPDLWKAYYENAQGHIIKAIWIKSHEGHTENERCDSIARNEAMKMKENNV